jgi:branched-chain amino acid aminotransferase
MGIYYVDGEYVPEEKAVIPVTDMAVLRGYAVFDFLRTYGGKPFHLNDHLQRLRRSAELIGLSTPWPKSELELIVNETVRRNAYEEANIRLVVTGGFSSDSITPDAKSRLLVLVTKVKSLPKEWYTDGVKVVTTEVNRYIPEAKSTNYVNAVIALGRAREKGAVESLYVDDNLQVREGTTTNVFLVKGSRLMTPEAGILPGITRKVILTICRDVFPVMQRSVSVDELRNADEVFISASNKQVVPVVRVDDFTIGDGKPGKVTLEVMQRFLKYTEEWGRSALHSV